MSQEKQLRSQIREYVKSIIKEENFISRYLRNMAKRMERREFDRIMAKRPELKKGIQKITQAAEKEYISKLEKYVKKHNLK
jgi:hypothetical protein|tara:strand:- start:4707 stop:4949 length:243 start_codon:yes stop_codon:yes gene_type:complete